jgi:hypothetical protein
MTGTMEEAELGALRCNDAAARCGRTALSRLKPGPRGALFQLWKGLTARHGRRGTVRRSRAERIGHLPAENAS